MPFSESRGEQAENRGVLEREVEEIVQIEGITSVEG
jgi:hypothetical protein